MHCNPISSPVLICPERNRLRFFTGNPGHQTPPCNFAMQTHRRGSNVNFVKISSRTVVFASMSINDVVQLPSLGPYNSYIIPTSPFSPKWHKRQTEFDHYTISVLRLGPLDCEGGFMVLGGWSSRESKNACGEVGGVEKMSSTGSKFMVRGKECLEGCVGAGGGEVNGGGNDFGVSKSLLGEIPGVVIGESDGEIFRDDGGAIW
ncbi:hypothetical protein Tco_0058181 [Tanacetum coccineum]